MDVLTSETCWAVDNRASVIKLVNLYSSNKFVYIWFAVTVGAITEIDTNYFYGTCLRQLQVIYFSFNSLCIVGVFCNLTED